MWQTPSDQSAPPPPSLMEILRQSLDGLWPTTPDLSALLDRMEMPK